MKKILFAMAAALMLCSCGQQFGLAYGLDLTGDGDGKFTVSFPQGQFSMDGTADINFQIGDTIPFGAPTTKAEVLQSGDAKQRAALKAVNDSIAQQFGATGGDGTYDLWIHGFVKETGTGLVFEIDRHLTNRANAPAIRLAAKDDPFPYIK